jgi:DNA polymerase III epsilon subunit family exonuclease
MIDDKSIFIAFDTETTGLSAAQGRIVEIAALKFDIAGNVLGELSQLINPQGLIPPTATAIHGITDETVADMPFITDVLPRFLDFAADERAVLLAQNALFDIGFVNHEALRHDIRLSRNIILDLIDFTRQTFPNLPSYALERVCRTFGLVETQAHRAMADSILVMRLFLHCVHQYESIDDALAVLNEMYHYTFGGPMVVKIDEELMQVITQALETGETLEIVYAGGSKRGMPRQIVPTLLFNRDGVMFLTARCLLSNSNKQFRLDRIKECRIAPNDTV